MLAIGSFLVDHATGRATVLRPSVCLSFVCHL